MRAFVRTPLLFSSSLVLATLLSVTARAQQTPTLIKDINPGFTDSIPQGRPVVANGLYYFVSNDFTHGRELWRSDGTADGTFLVKDINPGSGDGVLTQSLYVFNDTLYFTGDDPTTGAELWTSDGTEAGTRLVVDINHDYVPSDSSSPQAFHQAGGKLVFEAGDSLSAFGTGLYATDGTADGTVLLINAWRSGSEDWDCASVGAVLYCSLQTGGQSAPGELFKTDGTLAGTTIVAPATLASLPEGLTAVGNDVFFWASDDAHGVELWKSDGTLDGTVLVKDCAPGPANSIGSTGFLGLYTAYDGGFIFSGSDGTGQFMWKTDGTEAGTVPVGDNLGSTQVLDFSWLTSRGPDVFFQGGESTLGTELWITDGTKAGTHQIKDINPGRDSGLEAEELEFTLVGNDLYFVANDGTHDWQLWRSDGTESGTVPLTGFVTSYDREIRPTGMQALGSKILFFADDGAPGAKLWSLDLDAPAFTGPVSGSGGTGGTDATGGTGATGGSAAAGGSLSNGGSGGTATGGSDAGQAGSDANGGSSPSGSAGHAAAGAPAKGGSGGASNTAGRGGAPTSGGHGAGDDDDSKHSSGCGCRTASERRADTAPLVLLLASLLVVRRRRRGAELSPP